jgi:hypothetical protein
MNASFDGSQVDQSALQLIIDQVEELVVTLIEEVRARPGVAVAILAGVVGAVAGSVVAGNLTRPKPPKRRLARPIDTMAATLEMLGVLMRHPALRSYARQGVEELIRKRFGT